MVGSDCAASEYHQAQAFKQLIEGHTYVGCLNKTILAGEFI